MLGNLRILRSKVPRFQARLAEDFREGFLEYCRSLAALLTDLAALRRRGSSVSLNESMASLRGILARFETELAGSSPDIAGDSSAEQETVARCILASVLTWRDYTSIDLTSRDCNSTGSMLFAV